MDNIYKIDYGTILHTILYYFKFYLSKILESISKFSIPTIPIISTIPTIPTILIILLALYCVNKIIGMAKTFISMLIIPTILIILLVLYL